MDAQVNGLEQMAPKLAPTIVPRGYDDSELRCLFASTSGGDSLSRILAAHAPSVSGCAFCGNPGEVNVDDPESTSFNEDLLDELRFTTVMGVDFAAKEILLQKCLVCLPPR